jgi:cytochrome c-type biogenesis protein CcmH
MKKLLISIVLLLGFVGSLAFAQELDPRQNERYNKLSQEIRCVVCQSEPVATSSAKIAADMRDVIKEHILKGESDSEIRKFFATHYGEYVLLRPQLSVATIALWASPFVLLILGGAVVLILMGKLKSEPEVIPNETIPSEYDAEALAALKEIEK